MRRLFIWLRESLFHTDDDFRVQLFNIFALAGMVISIVMSIHAVAVGRGVLDTSLKMFSGVFSLAMLIYCRRSKRYQFCYTVSIFFIFILLFGGMFFTGGGYRGGITAFFVMAVMFTTCMLDGKTMFIMITLELTAYISMCLLDFHYPTLVSGVATGAELMTDIIVCFVAASVAVGVTSYRQGKLYQLQKHMLDEQNSLLAETNRSKTEFLANTSHEMRTPLTVISVNVQTVMRMLQRAEQLEADDDVSELLMDAQEEIMRLSRMVGGMLSLGSFSEATERHKIDFATLLTGVSDMLRLVLHKRGNQIHIQRSENLFVFCDADLISQVLINLIQNASRHTEQDTIKVTAVADGGQILVSVRDHGSGISADLLPRVFERGVSEGGTGFGLYLSKVVVESHGGSIWIESTEGQGTCVYFTVPVYQGQFEKGEKSGA